MWSYLTDVIEVTVRGFLHSRYFIKLIQQLVCVELALEKGQPVKTERLPNSEQQPLLHVL